MKADLTELERRMDLRFEAQDARIDGRFAKVDEQFETLKHELLESFERGLKEQARGIYQVMATTIAGAMLAVGMLAFAAARLF